MNKDEFNEWIAYHQAAFPDLGDWLNRLPDRKATLEVWLDVLGDTDPADAKEATRRMTTGQEPSPAGYEREITARRIAEIARSIKAGRRLTKEQQEELPDYTKAKWPMSGLYRELRKAVAAGKSTADIMKKIPIDADREPRCKCLRCRDCGVVPVWANASVHAAMQGAEAIPVYSAVCRCDCYAAKRWSERLAVFSPERFCVFGGKERRTDELRSWTETYKATRVQRMANHEPAFDEWNQS